MQIIGMRILLDARCFAQFQRMRSLSSIARDIYVSLYHLL